MEVIYPECDFIPPFLILNDDKMFPITGLEFQGETEEKNPDKGLKNPVHLIKGVIKFFDIFGRPHQINYDQSEDDPDILWKNRVKTSNKFRNKIGKGPETNKLKLIPPRIWSEVPEKEWPDWMKN